MTQQNEIIKMARKDEVLKMAVQAGYDEHQAKFDTRITAFAKLVAAKSYEKGFFTGFEFSSEGFNAEYPFGDAGIDVRTDKDLIQAMKESRGEA
jgi:hypothetical protein